MFIHHEGRIVYIKEMNYEENMTGRKLLNLRDRQTDRHTNNICDNVTLMGMVSAGQEMGQSVMDHESNWVALVRPSFPCLMPHLQLECIISDHMHGRAGVVQ